MVNAEEAEYHADVLEFERFRYQLIAFLRLPKTINEIALRAAIRQASPRVLDIYLDRAGRLETGIYVDTAEPLEARAAGA